MSSAMQIMVVDDEENICEALAAWFQKDGYGVETAGSGPEALERMQQRPCDVYFVDIKMPGMDGLELLARLIEKQPDVDVIMITAHGSIQTAVEAMKRGACDYLCKPFDPDQLSLLMERVMASKALRDENIALREQLAEQREAISEGFVAQSETMQKVFSIIEDVAPSSAPVLITGETGVGKELIAHTIHTHSEQSYGPFVAINCGALSESLLESELFGHERGAFTGAAKARRGRLEMANNGTLFLDEVGEISPHPAHGSAKDASEVAGGQTGPPAALASARPRAEPVARQRGARFLCLPCRADERGGTASVSHPGGAVLASCASASKPAGPINWARMRVISRRWLPTPRVQHPWPTERFYVTTRGRSPVR